VYFNYFLQFLVLGVYLALTLALVRKYFLTRDAGFVWLGGAVVIWPLLSDWFDRVVIRRLIRGQPVKLYPFTLAAHGQMSIGSLITALYSPEQLIGVGLLLIAVLYLCEAKLDNKRDAVV